MKTTNRFKPGSSSYLFILAICCTAAWGSAFPTIRLARLELPDTSLRHLWAFAGMRFTLAGIIILYLYRHRVQWSKFKENFPLMFMGIFFQIALHYALFYASFRHAPAYLIAIAASTGTLWWTIITPLVDKSEKFHLRQILLLSIGIMGVALATYKEGFSFQSLLQGELSGLLLTTLATLSSTIGLLIIRPLKKRGVNPNFYNGSSLFFGGLVLLALSFPALIEIISNMNQKLFLLTIYLACVSAFGFNLWFHLITIYQVSRLASYRLLISFFGVSESLIFLPEEKPGPFLIMGGILIFLSIYLMEKQRNILSH
ncbi:DMT family transporter [Lentisphaera profundi]|uniref:DMT family transporter n=1 Tax=Lentisphaera profundi TaxID=1658616 RepID=A0ABY7VPI5_9BACT|nr:DMT family transporter [Lentisphaera profundi]WDE95617.1 DMT family transporter [Lentisphaera profundi]